MTFKPAKAIMASIAAVAALAAGAGSAAAAETSVSAADLAKSQPITVKADADISSKNLVAIQLAAYSAAQTDGTNITGYDLKDAGLAAAVDDALTKAGISRTASGNASTVYETANPMAWVVTNLLDSTSSPWAGQLRNFLDQLKNEQAVKDAAGTKLAKGADANTMTANVTPGVYAIIDRTTDGKASIAMMNGTGINGMTTLKGKDGKTYKLGEVEYKVSDAPVPVKKIVEDGQSKDTNETAIGKTVNYKVTAKVPNWTGYDHYYLALNDTMSQGLTFNNDVKATVAGKTVTVKTVSDNGRIRILFAPTSDNSSDIVADKANYPVDADIVVTYSATVNRNAVIGGNGNPNGIELEYSHNPNTVTDHETTPGNTVKTYVGAFAIVKQDSKGASLEGAEFNVYEAGKTTPVKFVKTGNTYRVADKTETTGTTTTVTAGNATITGVDGAYDVVETKSPFGNAIKARFTTTVTVNQKTGEYKAALTKADANHLVASDNKFTLTVTNCRNIGDMPKTGATWLAIYTTAGLLLVAAGAAMYLRRARA
uniref:isopeptide-forming domain-containing fimbrial protein n=1 Tax=Bifidobacterium adolescentis TaxID=1680 RepID=UPI00359C4725